MAIDDRPPEGEPVRAARPTTRLFAVRLWSEEVAGGVEYRGSVRDVASGAFRGFRDWSDLVAFLTDRMEEDQPTPSDLLRGGNRWSSLTDH